MNTMMRSLLLLAPVAGGVIAAATLVGTVSAQGDAPPPNLNPKRYKVDRYKSIWQGRSPFEIIVEEEEIEEEIENPLEDYAMAGYYKRGTVYHVTIVNKKDPADKHFLTSGKPTEEGFELLKFTPGENYKKSSIKVRRAGLVGDIGFDEKRLKPATGIAGGINRQSGSSKARTGQNKPQPGRTSNAPGAVKPGQKPGSSNTRNNSEAAKQIREMLKNRASSRGGGTTSKTSSTKREPRRRVILPPSK